MGLISQVTSFEIDDEDVVSVDFSPTIINFTDVFATPHIDLITTSNIDTIQFVDAFTVPDVELNLDQTVDLIEVTVQGPQGPPGLQNVFVQTENPALQYGWGPEQENYIWLEV